MPRTALESAPLDETMLLHFVRISQALAGRLDFQSAIQAVSEEVREILPYDHLDICLLTGQGEALSAYETGLHTSWGSVSELHTLSRSPIRSLLWGEVPYILAEDALADERFVFEGAFNHPIFDARLRSRLHVPLRVQGAVIGALSCSMHEPGLYTLEDVRVARHVADLIAPYCFALRKAEEAKASAIVEAETRAREEGLRIGALRLTEALEHERQRIGMDLHDQTLADLTRLLHRVARLGEQDNLPGEVLGPVAGSLKTCMHELRRIIDDARPGVLQLFGFEHAVEDVLERAAQSSGGTVATRLENEIGGTFDSEPDSLKVALFRIVQEAVNNAARHARAASIVVRIAEEAERIAITIDDDGVGLGGKLPLRVGGIDNMQTRARLVGAEFEIGAPPDGPGTRVTIRLPHLVRLRAAE